MQKIPIRILHVVQHIPHCHIISMMSQLSSFTQIGSLIYCLLAIKVNLGNFHWILNTKFILVNILSPFQSATACSECADRCESSDIWLALSGVPDWSGVPICLGVAVCRDCDPRDDLPVILPSSPRIFEVDVRVFEPSSSTLKSSLWSSVSTGLFPIKLGRPSLCK